MTRSAPLALALLLAACASGPGTKADDLDRALYDYSAAIRWNNFEVAAEWIDPEALARNPLTPFELERLKQVQVAGYTVVASRPTPDGGVVRDVEIRLVNVHTQTERIARVRETWRWDEPSQRWVQADGLPRFANDD